MIAKPSLSAKRSSTAPQPLADWIAQQLAPTARVQMRLRGNILHVLCETSQPLHRAGALARLVEALLAQSPVAHCITQVYPQVYQVYLYSRQQGHRHPDWTAPLYLNRLERHQVQLQDQAKAALHIAAASAGTATATAPAEAATTSTVDTATTAVVLSQVSLARQGDPAAIAWYLSEVLSTLDVGVWVSIRAVRGRVTPSAATANTDPMPRLWVFCEAAYSPDPLLIAEPVTERLRQLQLTQFKDAVLVVQVHGEAQPDWSLRIDLTPPDDMLREWARWGDEAAIVRLVNQAIAPQAAKATVERKADSLHLMLHPTEATAVAPDEAAMMAIIAPLLEGLAPQGLLRAMCYGHVPERDTPNWVRCLSLPALEHPALAEPPTALAQQGDLLALTYLLTRLLNPDLDAQLATGGIRVQVLRRQQLLHIMADGPVCPARRQVVPPVLDFLKTLQWQDIQGVRLYGRRAGQQRPSWSAGSDFQPRSRLVPDAEPQFAVSDTYVGDLLTPDQEAALRPELTPAAVGTALTQAWQRSLETLRQLLISTQLVVPQSDLPRRPPAVSAGDRRDALKIGLVWGLVGGLLALQIDWLLGQALNPTAQNRAVDAAPLPDAAPVSPSQPPSLAEQLDWQPREWGNGEPEAADVFTADEFTQGSPFTAEATGEGISLGGGLSPLSEVLATSPYASFRSQQLDEKLALYHQRLQESGPPDVLIMGSSRALRGVDPAALRQELTALGFGQLDIFNFGINGATAQVVDLTIRRILTAEQLPRLILWADGARALNSGRTDVTYNAIATSEGYQQLGQRRPESAAAGAEADSDPTAAEAATPQSVGESLRNSYQALDQTLSDRLGQWSALYADRDQVKDWVRDRLLTPLVAPLATSGVVQEAPQNTSDLPIPEGSRIDFDGFLALDVRFNPATYYQLYARVPGLYDSDYEAFELQGAQFEALQRLLQYTQAQDIPVVFVNTPLTDEYLDRYRLAAEEDFRRLMLRLSATEEGFIFRDLGQVWPQRYDYFSDPSHLNRYGAYQVSHRLAQDPMIPWPRAQQPGASAPPMN